MVRGASSIDVTSTDDALAPGLSVEAAQALINQCILDFLDARSGSTAIQDKVLQIRIDDAHSFSLSEDHFGNTNDKPLEQESSTSLKVLAQPPQNLQPHGMLHGRPSASASEQQPQMNDARISPRNPSETMTRSPMRKLLPVHNNKFSLGPIRSSSLHPKPSPSPPHVPPIPRQSGTDLDPPSDNETERRTPQVSTHAPHQDAESSYSTKKIFKPLEDHIAKRFGTYECLNSAFANQSRRPRVATKGTIDTSQRHDLRSKTQSSATAALSDIDPKTLLIGDIAENGLWWTGKGDGTIKAARKPDRKDNILPEKASGLVSSRSPYIAWTDVSDWYFTVLNAGRDWRAILRNSRNDEPKNLVPQQSHEDELKVDAAFAEARSHVHRVLLRSSDNLLKRPGRPLTDASCLRFLLILLANPMLYPGLQLSPMATATRPSEQRLDRQRSADETRNHGAVLRNSSEAGDQSHAFAILKRILGLLSNTSGECQRYLTSWFSRYNEMHFRSLVGLIQTYVSYRLRRQGNRRQTKGKVVASDLIPSLSGLGASASAELHAALGLGGKASAAKDKSDEFPIYSDDWQARAAARVMALLFAANKSFLGKVLQPKVTADTGLYEAGSLSRHHMRIHGQLLSTTDFYNSMVDYYDVVFDFDTWEGSPSKFTFCQYPFFLSLGSKIRIMEHDARRQMEIKAREAFFKSLLRNSTVQKYMILKVRRECLVEDSLRGISEVVGQGQEEIKKGLKVQFVHEEGVDAGGLRKEWFLLLAREIFDPDHG